jgi:hypothetical protein
MAPLEYLLLFESIILGLAVGDLAKSLHRLLAARARVQWDWLAPLAALMILVKIVNHWWRWFRLEPIANQLTFEAFLGVLAATLLLYLISADVLPDEVPSGPIDLREHYRTVSGRIWILFIIHGVLIAAINAWAVAEIHGARYRILSPDSLIAPAALSLLFIRARWWHVTCLLALSGFYAVEFFGRILGA